ncbi:MAG: methyltransferase domain-containing protein [Candidatus Aminicenantes bacterium]|nr:methyltransferase domain-containing protein [Candidatus Aminicenantes bacterium]
MTWVLIPAAAVAAVALLLGLNVLSYRVLKGRILRRRKWDLNVCSGRTDGGGVNVDIALHAKLPRFVLIDSVTRLPFKDGQFETVLCSHTMEHVEDPNAFWRELKRVGKNVTIVLPPLWDLGGVLNFWEHRWIFLTFRKVHDRLPPRIRLPFSRAFQRRMGQRIHA